MPKLIAYMCRTQTDAFNLCELIEENGGKAHKYLGEKRVLSDFEFTDPEIARKASFYIARPDEAEEVEIKLFGSELSETGN